MKGFKWAHLVVVLVCSGIVVAAHGIGQLYAQEKAQQAAAFKAALSVAAGQEVTIRHNDVAPGWVMSKHYHTGQVFLYVLEGTGKMEIAGQTRIAGPGEVIQALPGEVMIMGNASTTERLKFVLFQVGPTGAPLSVKTE